MRHGVDRCGFARVSKLKVLLLFTVPTLYLQASVKDELERISRCLTSVPCTVNLISATQNEIATDEFMWAFEYSSGKERKIVYAREKSSKFAPLAGEEFHRLALNPQSKVVARYNPAFFLRGGKFQYQIPAIWKTEGIDAANTYAFSLTCTEDITIDAQSLDDTPSVAVSITTLGKNQYEIKSKRRISADQPALKFVIKSKTNSDIILQLAVPFKPQPNRFLFGVVGFLFGGLIAVMVLVGKRKAPKTTA